MRCSPVKVPSAAALASSMNNCFCVIFDGIAGIVTVGHTAVVDIAVVGQSIVAVCIELYRLMSDEIDSRLRIIGSRLMLMIELSFPFSCNRLGVVLKSFYATLFCVCECLSIIYSCILL